MSKYQASASSDQGARNAISVYTSDAAVMAPKPKPWLRVYTEITTDHKLRRLPPAERWLWLAVMVLARKSPQGGRLLLSEGVPVSLEDMADEAAVSLEETRSGLASFEAKEMMHRDGEVYVVTHWNARQYESDNTTERSAKHRANKNTQAEAMQRPIDVASNAKTAPIENDATTIGRCASVTEPRVQNTDTETDTKTHGEPAPTGARVSVAPASKSVVQTKPSPDFEQFWAAYPRRINKHSAWLEWERRIKEGAAPLDLILAARHLAEHCDIHGTEEQFIPHAATFIGRQRRWEEFVRDVPAPVVTTARARASPRANGATTMAAKFADTDQAMNELKAGRGP